MLAKIERGHHDFHALAKYLVHGRERPTNPDRVAWTFAHNIFTDDPRAVATIMEAFAALSVRCTNPCYHMTVNWHQDEQPTPEIMQEIARRVLEMAGLGEHQALVMGHGDKPHKHMHFMINRVHPDTGKAWSTSHDYRKFDRIMKELCGEYGFRYAPGHKFEPEATDQAMKGPRSSAYRAAMRGANTGRPQWSAAQSRAYGERISEHLDQASSWEDIDMLLAEDGLTLERKGRGYVVGDGRCYTKLSALRLGFAANGYGRKFGRKPAPAPWRVFSSRPVRRPARNLWMVDAIDIARMIGSKEDLRAAVLDAKGQRKARLAYAPLMVQLMEELKEQWRAATSLSAARRRRKPGRTKRRRPQPRDGPER